MIDRQRIKADILASKERSQHYAQGIHDRQFGSFEEFSHLFLGYLCGKFFLNPEDVDTDDFYQICQYSVERASHYPPGAIDAAEFASKCGGATTATNKKVLFIMAIRRELHIPLTVEEAVSIGTLSQLISCCYGYLEETP